MKLFQLILKEPFSDNYKTTNVVSTDRESAIKETKKICKSYIIFSCEEIK